MDEILALKELETLEKQRIIEILEGSKKNCEKTKVRYNTIKRSQ